VLPLAALPLEALDPEAPCVAPPPLQAAATRSMTQGNARKLPCGKTMQSALSDTSLPVNEM
jgi:hypothetical protein